MNIKSDFFTNLLKCCSPPPFPNISIYFTVFQTVYKTIPLSLSLSFLSLSFSLPPPPLSYEMTLSLSRFELNGFFCVLGGIQDNVSLSLSLVLCWMFSVFQAVYKMTPSIKKPDDVSTPEKMTKKLFAKMDANGDGEISWEEFYDGAMKDSLVLAMLQLNPD